MTGQAGRGSFVLELDDLIVEILPDQQGADDGEDQYNDHGAIPDRGLVLIFHDGGVHIADAV